MEQWNCHVLGYEFGDLRAGMVVFFIATSVVMATSKHHDNWRCYTSKLLDYKLVFVQGNEPV